MKPEYQANYLTNIDIFLAYIILFLAVLEKSISTVAKRYYPAYT